MYKQYDKINSYKIKKITFGLLESQIIFFKFKVNGLDRLSKWLLLIIILIIITSYILN